MDYLDFHRRLVAALPPGTVLQNPGGGTTTILNYTASDNLVYRRGRTRIYVSIRELHVAHQLFQGQMVSSTDLRNFAPKIFDSNHSGHSCNCTLLFMALKEMGLVDRIEGVGKSGNPFRVHLRGSVDDQRQKSAQEVSMLERFHVLIDAVDRKSHRFPPTLIYNEGWMLRLVLDWFQTHRLPNHPLHFLPEATWYSESLLPTPFKARCQGDPRAEGRTHADGIVGHIAIGNLAKTDAELLAGATQLVVIEAKIHSSLSMGISNAPTYDQVSRTVACICEMLSRAGRRPAELTSLAFVVIAPEQCINAGTITAKLDKRSIEAAVRLRVQTFSPELDPWWEEWFIPTLKAIRVEAMSWEGLIEDIATIDEPASRELATFYDRCLKYNAARV